MVFNRNLFKIPISIFIILNFIFMPISYSDDDDILSDTVDVNSEIEHTTNTKKTNNDSSLNLNTRACIILDRTSQKILYGKNENTKVKMASTTKIMTATVILENCKLTDVIEVSKKAAGTGGSRLGLKAGDKISIHDLLYGLMLCSGNDAAVALAESCAGSIEDFSNLMNSKAKELNLLHTHFESPHGLDSDEHYTTAYELSLLSNYALKNPIFAKIVGTKNYTITINGYPKSLSNTNELLGNLNGVYGIKTGFTNGANRCLVTACKRNNLDIICVVLGCDTKKFRTQDSIKLIEYAFSNYEVVNISDIINSKFNSWKDNNLSKFNIIKGTSNKLDITLSNVTIDKIPIKKDDVKDINVNITCQYNLNSPVYKNSKVGNLTVGIKNDILFDLDIVSSNDIKRKSCFDYFSSFMCNFANTFESVL